MIFLSRKAWNILPYDKQKALALAEASGVDEFAVLLLLTRGLDTPQKITDFVYCEDTVLPSPFTIKDMDKAVERIMTGIENGEKMLIYGDYDCDGVTATALLYTYLSAMGADVSCRIPSRISDGYGLSDKGVEEIAKNRFSLVITVDNGIAAINEAERLYNHGIDLVVTDHHTPGEILPRAAAVINPHRTDDDSVYTDLAGVGVALMLCAALEDGDTESVIAELGELAAIGTIADIVPLKGINRTIVSPGLKQLRNTSRPGLMSLIERATGGRELNSVNVAFMLAPRINAAGRMDDALLALNLLLTDDPEKADEYATRLCELNAERQKTESEIAASAIALFEKRPEILLDRVIVASGKAFHPGVIGIAAARLVDRFSKPAIVISISDDGVCRGSCRSVEGLSMYSALSYCSDLLVQFGGHRMAAGFSIKEENIEAFRIKINEYARSVGDIYPTLNIDCRLNPANISTEITDSLALLEPFGAENPTPVFGLFQMTVAGVKSMGGGKHIKVSLVRDRVTVNASWFGKTPAQFPFIVGDTVDAAVKIENNEYMGRRTAAVYIKEMRPSGADDRLIFGSLAICDRLRRNEEITEEQRQLVCPTRKVLADVYRLIKQMSPLNIPEEILAVRVGLKPEDAGKIQLCLLALTDSGLIADTAEGYTTVPVSGKTNLADNPLLKKAGYIDK